MTKIQPWHRRMDTIAELSPEDAMQAEIRDLRAALAKQAEMAPATSLIENAARQYVAAVNDPYTSVVGELRWFKQLEAALAQPSSEQGRK